MYKKVIAILVVVGLLLAVPIHAYAAVCPDVRDYKEHRYNYRHYEGVAFRVLVDSHEINQPYKDPNGVWHNRFGTLYTYRVYRIDTFICVCGLGYSDRILLYDESVFEPY